MADIKLNEVTYTDINNVLMENANDGDYVKFSTGGGSTVKKVLYTDGKNMARILSDINKLSQLISEFPVSTQFYEADGYITSASPVENAVVSEIQDIRLTVYNTVSGGPINYETLDTIEKVFFRTISGVRAFLTDFSNVNLRDTGVTKTIAGETFYEAEIVE